MSGRPADVGDVYPLTPMQQLMLMHVLGTDDSALANQIVYEVLGPLDESRLQRAWTRVIARHGALRTAFLWEGLERPVQVVRTEVASVLATSDVSQLPAAEAEARLAALCQADRGESFRLERPPLVRAHLIRRDAQRHVLVLNAHHLIVDRWSLGVLLADLAAAYRGEEVAESGAPPFRDYVRWVREQRPTAALAYWREYLAGFRRPTLSARGARTTTGGRQTLSRTLDASLTRALEVRASESGTTPASWIQVAVGLAIGRLLGVGDVVFGLTVSGRPPELEGVEATVGSFVNNVPVRVRPDPEGSVRDWVLQVQVEQARRQRFEHLSVAEIRECADIPVGEALFDLLLLVNLTPTPDPFGPELRLEAQSSTLDAGYPLLLAIGLDGDRLLLQLVHDAHDGGAVVLLERVAEALAALVEGDPGRPRREVLPGDVPLSEGPASPTRIASASASEPADPVERMLAIWREVLATDAVGLDDDFFALGGTSLQAARLFLKMERSLGRTLPLSLLFQAGSVRALLRALDQPVQPAGTLVRIRSGGTQPPLFVVPGIGGNVVGLSPLARVLGADQPFYGLQSRGLSGESVPLETLEAIAEDHAETVARLTREPVDLLGLCWGAAVAYEMALRLARRGTPVRSLAMLDPAVLLREDADHAEGGRAFLRERIELYWDELKDADWRGRGRILLQKARRAARAARSGGLPEGSRLERWQHQVREANRIAVTRYHPTPGRVRTRLFITADRVLGGGADPRMEWLSLIEPVPDVVRIAGTNSGDAISTSHVGSFAEALAEWLRQVRDVDNDGGR